MNIRTIKTISLQALPILIMIGLIPVVSSDILLTGLYIMLSSIALNIQKEKHDLLIYTIGFFFMLISETIFILTGVETFQRNSLFGIMPLWLPFLWAYGFVAIRRVIHIIEK